MAVEITTISAHPETAERVRNYRDTNDDVSTMDDALRALLSEAGE